MPVAITSFVSETAAPRMPSLAVASGSHVFIYRNLRPYYKFVLPPEDVNLEEQELWWGGSEGGGLPRHVCVGVGGVWGGVWGVGGGVWGGVGGVGRGGGGGAVLRARWS